MTMPGDGDNSSNGKVMTNGNGAVADSVPINGIYYGVEPSEYDTGPRPVPVRNEDDDPPFVVAFFTYIGYVVLVLMGHFRDFLHKVRIRKSAVISDNPKNVDFVPLYQSFESFYHRNINRRLWDCANRPLCGTPGTYINVMDRESDDMGWNYRYPGTSTKALNMGSYNYLGFAENSGPCTESAAKGINEYGLGVCSPRQELGTLTIHRELERLVSRFVGCEDALTFGMGFATNSMNIPALVGKGCLIISDELNHASARLGCRLSGATIRPFKHNDPESLEAVLRQAIVQGQPRKNRTWKKILVVVEGVYSMEGSIVNLPRIIELRKKYKFYLYLDEAHSIGALGSHGRGVADYYGLDPNDVDVMMGTFSKSFGAAGGYVAGRKAVIDHIRIYSQSSMYACSMPPPVVKQIISSMSIIMGLDGTDYGRKRIRQLSWNSHYFRTKLSDSGLMVYGNFDSPVVPLITFHIPKIAYFARECLKRGLAVAIVGYPAVSLLKARVRFCLSANHTKEDLDRAIEIITNIATETRSYYKSKKTTAIEFAK